MKTFPFKCNFADDTINNIQHNLINSPKIAFVVDHVAKKYIQLEQNEIVAEGTKRGIFTGKSRPDEEWEIFWKIPLTQVNLIENLALGVELPEAWRKIIGDKWWRKNQEVVAAKTSLIKSEEPEAELDIF